MTDPNLYAVGYDVGFEDGFKEAQGRVEELEADKKHLRSMIADHINSTGDDPEIMAATRAEWAARALVAEADVAKAVEGLEKIKTVYQVTHCHAVADAALAELKGEK